MSRALKDKRPASTDIDSSEESPDELQTYKSVNLESTTDHEILLQPNDEEQNLDNEFEQTAIRCFRYFVFFLMIAATAATGGISWYLLQQEEQRHFNTEFDIVVQDIKYASEERASAMVDHFRSLSSTISGLAINSNTSWPFFTDSLNYPLIVGNFLQAVGVSMLALAPIIKNQREMQLWGNYSQANQGWIPTSLLLEQKTDPFNFTEIFPAVFRYSAGEKVPEEGDGPFAPVWQMFQAPRDGKIVNFNMLSDPHYVEIYESLKEEKSGALSDRLGGSNAGLLENFEAGTQAYIQANVVSMYISPVFKDPAHPDEIVATLSAGLEFVPLFGLRSDEKTPPVDVVLDDGCLNQFTMRVTGSSSELIGFGNLQDSELEEEERSFPFAPTLRTHHVEGTHCSYQVRVFPTKEFWDTYHTSYPASTAGIVTAVFGFIGIVLFLYDWVVHFRERRIRRVASQSEKILSVLYPKNVRDRLFGLEKTVVVEPHKTSQGGMRRFNEDLLKKATKYQVKRFMRSSPSGHPDAMENLDSKPIADLFVNATVLYADISGFTAWSSVREPSQVFTLLETVFRAFDVIAKRRRVFKVETVGDCYVAVTGLPEPTKSHASIMAVFARECVAKFGQLVRVLETTLGPDTGELGLRVGLHSGSVTAGVLRGDKSRFQLFGNTVNTASRIEATGQFNRIHVSEETADLLAVAGKSHWLTRRDKLVTAKGKGKLQTYWLMTKQEEAGVKITSLSSPSTEETNADTSSAFIPSGETSLNLRLQSLEEIERMLPLKTKRLCQWNVDVLTRLLKQIVAHRLASNERSTDWEDVLSKREKDIRRQISVLDEVVEIIPLPGFDQRVYKRQQDPEKITLSDKVVEQIRLYVACIAAMYRDNPFHNFEHASHVMMSVSKLLSRIVAADDVLDQDENAPQGNLGWSMHDNTYGITSDPMTQFSVILAAMIHDVDHSGVSNDQLIKEEHKLANLFKNKSVAEQNSTVLAWDILMDPRFQDFRRTIYATPFELDRFRQLMTNTVLATDIMDKELQQLRRNRWDAAFKGNPAVEEGTRDNVNRKATIVIEHLIQASDVAHTMQHWHIYCKWNERLFHEMAIAYKAGRLGFNPAEKWYEGEIGFLDNYVIPLAKKLKNCGVFGVSSDEYLNYAMENRREWEEKGREFVATLTQRYVDEASTEMMAEGHRRSSRRLKIDFDSPNEQVVRRRGK